eukprot:TRINITY_DN1266_c3_g1_i1.p1 TRINITY_DN1266_c3_g1~~TRINITY_DN1266_c3_g1_i1.p1  ORF type:complete len:322 (+),score=52.12 TRINITY_DN1266_c3_g1_i1:40-1005(+)
MAKITLFVRGVNGASEGSVEVGAHESVSSLRRKVAALLDVKLNSFEVHHEGVEIPHGDHNHISDLPFLDGDALDTTCRSTGPTFEHWKTVSKTTGTGCVSYDSTDNLLYCWKDDSIKVYEGWLSPSRIEFTIAKPGEQIVKACVQQGTLHVLHTRGDTAKISTYRGMQETSSFELANSVPVDFAASDGDKADLYVVWNNFVSALICGKTERVLQGDFSCVASCGVWVLLGSGSSVDVYTEELEYIKSIRLPHEPGSMTVSHGMLYTISLVGDVVSCVSLFSGADGSVSTFTLPSPPSHLSVGLTCAFVTTHKGDVYTIEDA